MNFNDSLITLIRHFVLIISFRLACIEKDYVHILIVYSVGKTN